MIGPADALPTTSFVPLARSRVRLAVLARFFQNVLRAMEHFVESVRVSVVVAADVAGRVDEHDLGRVRDVAVHHARAVETRHLEPGNAELLDARGRPGEQRPARRVDAVERFGLVQDRRACRVPGRP